VPIKIHFSGVVSLDAAFVPGPGVSARVQLCEDFRLRVDFTGGDPVVVVHLQASSDPLEVADEDAKWFNVATFSTVSPEGSGRIQLARVSHVRVRRIRAYLQTLNGGFAPTVTARVAAG
jgi:hypothetical protein